jgi:hypothetical protein
MCGDPSWWPTRPSQPCPFLASPSPNKPSPGVRVTRPPDPGVAVRAKHEEVPVPTQAVRTGVTLNYEVSERETPCC